MLFQEYSRVFYILTEIKCDIYREVVENQNVYFYILHCQNSLLTVRNKHILEFAVDMNELAISLSKTELIVEQPSLCSCFLQERQYWLKALHLL